jgi:aminopeptidase N
LKAYQATFGGGTASTDDFIAIAEREYGQSLDAFFNVWLYQPGKPASW